MHELVNRIHRDCEERSSRGENGADFLGDTVFRLVWMP